MDVFLGARFLTPLRHPVQHGVEMIVDAAVDAPVGDVPRLLVQVALVVDLSHGQPGLSQRP